MDSWKLPLWLMWWAFNHHHINSLMVWKGHVCSCAEPINLNYHTDTFIPIAACDIFKSSNEKAFQWDLVTKCVYFNNSMISYQTRGVTFNKSTVSLSQFIRHDRMCIHPWFLGTNTLREVVRLIAKWQVSDRVIIFLQAVLYCIG